MWRSLLLRNDWLGLLRRSIPIVGLPRYAVVSEERPYNPVGMLSFAVPATVIPLYLNVKLTCDTPLLHPPYCSAKHLCSNLRARPVVPPSVELDIVDVPCQHWKLRCAYT